MKFNPKFTEELAALPSVTRIHPDQDESTVQGALRVLYELQDLLARIAGMDAVTLQPAAGAQGEYTGLLLAQAYHRERGEERHEVIIPDTAHGTNPASAGMLGFDLIEIASKDGRVDLKALEATARSRSGKCAPGTGTSPSWCERTPTSSGWAGTGSRRSPTAPC